MAIRENAAPGWTTRKLLITASSVLAGIVFLITSFNSIINVDAKEIVVVQQPISGDLNVYTEPGWQWQAFGKVTAYPRRAQFGFNVGTENGKVVDESIRTQFNDGGHGNIAGTINWTMPLTKDRIIQLHKDFGSFEAIEQQLIRPSLQKTIYNVGPTMSSTESSAEKRPMIPQYIDDQLINGPYRTVTKVEIQKDAISGQDKSVNVVTIALDNSGKPMRETKSQISEYGLVLQPVAINTIVYDDTVQKQIKERQSAATRVQLSIANARAAEQDAITTEQQGIASAAKAKWEQETVNAKQIAEAEKKLKVAELAAREAAQFKHQQILMGEGEAARKKLVMEADGALDKKLEAYVTVNDRYATAMEKAQPGAWTPAVVMGGSGANSGAANASALVEMMTAKAARELAVDLGMQGKGATNKK